MPVPTPEQQTDTRETLREELRTALEVGDFGALFELMDFEGDKWGERSNTLLVLLDEEGVDAVRASALASSWFPLLSPPSKAHFWRIRMAPRLLQLQDASTFNDFDLIARMTVNEIATPIPDEQLRTAYDWIYDWLAHAVGQANQESTPEGVFAELEDKQENKRAILMAPDETGIAPVFHPLVLRGLRELAANGELDKFDKLLAEWLLNEIYQNANPSVTVGIALAAAPLLFELARAHNVEIGEGGFRDGDSEWNKLANSVSRAIVDNSSGADDVGAAWVDKQNEVGDLLERCSYYHSPDVARMLRELAVTRINESVVSLNKHVEDAEASMMPDWFSPGFESAMKVPLPDRRPTKPFHEDGRFNDPQRDTYFRLLEDLQQRVQIVDAGTTNAKSNASQIHNAREAIRRELGSPLARIALLEAVSTPATVRETITTQFLQSQLPLVQLESVLFDSIGAKSSLAHTKAWSHAVNQTEEAITTEAWSALDGWDYIRGSYEWGSDEANQLYGNLPDWLKSDDAARPDWLTDHALDTAQDDNYRSTRRTIAQFTLMVVLTIGPDQDAVQSRIETLLGDSELTDDARALLAAARLDLGLTRITGNIGPAVGFPQIISQSELPRLTKWITWATESDNAWESRAGMNALILMARLADTMDDVIIAAEIGREISNMSKARSHAKASVEAVLSLDGAFKGSALPLAYVAADLSRYARSVSRGIALPQLVAKPAWLPVRNGNGQELGNAAEVLDALVRRLAEGPRENLRRFSAAGGLPARLLLVTLLQIRLNQYSQDRRLTVRAPRGAEVLPLSRLKRAMREVLCGDAILLPHHQEEESLPWWKEEHPPWWQARYWVGHDVQGNDLTANNPDYEVPSTPPDLPDFQLVNWVPSRHTNPIGDIMMAASTLEASVPTMPPDFQHSGEDDEAFLLYNAGFLLDYDGRVEGELPVFGWEESRKGLKRAAEKLAESEDSYRKALLDRENDARTDDMIAWLKAPMHLSVSDFREQIEAAIAEVRQAEAELEAAGHESVAAILESEASEFIYEAAALEVRRAEALNKISTKDLVIENKKTEIEKINREVQAGRLDEAVGESQIAKARIEQAKLELQKAAIAKQQIIEEIEQIRLVLGGPTADPMKTETGLKVADRNAYRETVSSIFPLLGDRLTNEQKTKILEVGGITVEGDDLKANGRLAAMAVKIEFNMAKQLHDELIAAHNELGAAEAEDRRRKRRAKRNQIVTNVCKAIGAVVGAYFGGPAGAKLGAEIGAAVAELGIGIAENKPPEDILVGLVDNAFAIADAAGFDLEKELNDLGSEMLEKLEVAGEELLSELDSLFETAEESLGPILDSMPKVFDEPLFLEAFQAFGLEEVPQIIDLASNTFEDLKTDLGSFADNVAAEGGLGSILKNAANFESAEAFRRDLNDKLFANVFKETEGNIQQLHALGRSLGIDIAALKTEDGQRKAAERLSTLVVTKMGSQIPTFRSDIVGQWLMSAQKAGLTWDNDQVQNEVDQLLDNLFPNPETRVEVERSLRSALLDPQTKRGELQALLHGRDMQGNLLPDTPEGGWMGELDRKISELVKMEKPLSGSRKEVAQGRVNHLTDALVGFNTTLLPFLKAEEGASEAREALLLQLNRLQADLDVVELDEDKLRIEVGITQKQWQNAQVSEQQQRALLEAAGKRVELMQLGEERASLMSRVTELSHLKAETLEDAEAKSHEASVKRAAAAEARKQAAAAGVVARQAKLEAALRRGSEASRIHTDLNRAPLARSLNVAGAVADEARANHQFYLQHAFGAYRDLLRFYVSAGADEVAKVERPDELTGDKSLTWSSAFLQWLSHTEPSNIEQQSPVVTAKVGTGIECELTPEQIRALTSLDGLRIVARADEVEDEDSMVLLFSAEANMYGAFQEGEVGKEPYVVPPEWRRMFRDKEHELSPSARYVRHSDRVKISEQLDDTVEIETFDGQGKARANWPLNRRREYQIVVRADHLLVYRFVDRYAFYHDRVVEEFSSEEVSKGRILGIFLSIEDPDHDEKYLLEGAYEVEAEHLGQVVLSKREYRLRTAHKHTRKSLDDRLFLIENENPEQAVIERAALSNLNNDPRIFTVQGLPLGGTSRIRLIAKGSEDFEKVKLHVMYVHYEATVAGE